MKKKAMLTLLLILCGMAAFGQGLPLVVVLPLVNRAGAQYDQSVETLTDTLSVFINNTLKLNVIARTKLNKAMADLHWQPSDWDDINRTAEIGKALNAKYLLRGIVDPVGNNLIINVDILDINTADVLSSGNTELDKDITDASARMNGLAQLLVNYLEILAPPPPPPEPVKPPVAVVPPPKLPPEPEKNNKPIELFVTYFNVGIGLHVPMSVAGSLELFKFDIEHRETGIGFGYRPLYLYGWLTPEKKQSEYNYYGTGNSSESEILAGGVSFVNLTLYWNIMSLLNFNDSFYTGPYLDFNYLIMREELRYNEFIFTAGLQAGLRINSRYQIRFNVLSIETGYRLIKGNSGSDSRFFVTIKAGR